MDPDIEEIARLGSGNYHNAARGLHRYVHRTGKTLAVPISSCRLVVRRKKRGKRFEEEVNYPVIRLHDWLRFLLEESGAEFLLGGFRTCETEKYTEVFARFWHRFEPIDPEHVVYTKDEEQRAMTIPLAFHGDEGRGLAKTPVNVESYQPLIPWMGERSINMLGPLVYYMICVSIII